MEDNRVNGIVFYLRLYLLIVSQYIKAKMQYRVDFIISFFGMLFRDLTGFFALWVIFKSIPQLAGWNYYQLVFLYSFSLLTLTPLQLFFDKVWDLRNEVIDGSFIKYYFRPVNMMFYYMSGVLDIKGFSQLFFALTGLIYASHNLCIVWSMQKIVLIILLTFSSSLIMISLMILASSAAFWILNPFAVLELVFKLRDFSRYPMTIFNSFFKHLFTCIIPIGFIAYYPVQVILNRSANPFLILICPVIGFGLFFLAYIVWDKGVRGYSGTGS
jgi:ABC-2 type transport system permease protein